MPPFPFPFICFPILLFIVIIILMVNVYFWEFFMKVLFLLLLYIHSLHNRLFSSFLYFFKVHFISNTCVGMCRWIPPQGGYTYWLNVCFILFTTFLVNQINAAKATFLSIKSILKLRRKCHWYDGYRFIEYHLEEYFYIPLFPV